MSKQKLNKEQKADNNSVSQPIAKPNVVGSQMSHEFKVGERLLSDNIDEQYVGNTQINKEILKQQMVRNQKQMSIAYEILREFNKYHLSISDAEEVLNKLKTKAFWAARNECIRDGREIFFTTMSAEPL